MMNIGPFWDLVSMTLLKEFYSSDLWVLLTAVESQQSSALHQNRENEPMDKDGLVRAAPAFTLHSVRKKI